MSAVRASRPLPLLEQRSDVLPTRRSNRPCRFITFVLSKIPSLISLCCKCLKGRCSRSAASSFASSSATFALSEYTSALPTTLSNKRAIDAYLRTAGSMSIEDQQLLNKIQSGLPSHLDSLNSDVRTAIQLIWERFDNIKIFFSFQSELKDYFRGEVIKLALDHFPAIELYGNGICPLTRLVQLHIIRLCHELNASSTLVADDKAVLREIFSGNPDTFTIELQNDIALLLKWHEQNELMEQFWKKKGPFSLSSFKTHDEAVDITTIPFLNEQLDFQIEYQKLAQKITYKKFLLDCRKSLQNESFFLDQIRNFSVEMLQDICLAIDPNSAEARYLTSILDKSNNLLLTPSHIIEERLTEIASSMLAIDGTLESYSKMIAESESVFNQKIWELPYQNTIVLADHIIQRMESIRPLDETVVRRFSDRYRNQFLLTQALYSWHSRLVLGTAEEEVPSEINRISPVVYGEIMAVITRLREQSRMVGATRPEVIKYLQEQFCRTIYEIFLAQLEVLRHAQNEVHYILELVEEAIVKIHRENLGNITPRAFLDRQIVFFTREEATCRGNLEGLSAGIPQAGFINKLEK